MSSTANLAAQDAPLSLHAQGEKAQTLPRAILQSLPPPPSGYVWLIGGRWLPDGTLDRSPETFRVLRQPWDAFDPMRSEER